MKKKYDNQNITEQQRALIVFIRTHIYNNLEMFIKVHNKQPSSWWIGHPYYRWGYGLPEVVGHELTAKELWLIDEIKAVKFGQLRILCNRGQPQELIEGGRQYKPEDVAKETIHDKIKTKNKKETN